MQSGWRQVTLLVGLAIGCRCLLSDPWLLSQPQRNNALWTEPSYSAWWAWTTCSRSSLCESGPAGKRPHDLSIAICESTEHKTIPSCTDELPTVSELTERCSASLLVCVAMYVYRSAVLREFDCESNLVQRHVVPLPSRVLWHAAALSSTSTTVHVISSLVTQRRSAHGVLRRRAAQERATASSTVHQSVGHDSDVAHDDQDAERRQRRAGDTPRRRRYWPAGRGRTSSHIDRRAGHWWCMDCCSLWGSRWNDVWSDRRRGASARHTGTSTSQFASAQKRDCISRYRLLLNRSVAHTVGSRGGSPYFTADFFCLSARYLKNDAARITKLDVEPLRDESGELIYCGVKRAKVKVTSHKNIAAGCVYKPRCVFPAAVPRRTSHRPYQQHRVFSAWLLPRDISHARQFFRARSYGDAASGKNTAGVSLCTLASSGMTSSSHKNDRLRNSTVDSLRVCVCVNVVIWSNVVVALRMWRTTRWRDSAHRISPVTASGQCRQN